MVQGLGHSEALELQKEAQRLEAAGLLEPHRGLAGDGVGGAGGVELGSPPKAMFPQQKK